MPWWPEAVVLAQSTYSDGAVFLSQVHADQPAQSAQAGVTSDMDDCHALRLRVLWFFNQPAQIVRVAGQQHDWAFQF
jgi:hypothetical protein